MAAYFDGSGGYLSRASPLSHNAAYTVHLYFKLEAGRVDYHHIFHIGGLISYDGNSDFFGLDTDGVTTRAGCAGGTTNSFPTDAPINAGQWYLVQIVRESVTSLKIYLDGVLEFTLTNDVTSRTAASLLAFGTLNALPFRGFLAGVKTWASALTGPELAAEAGTYSPVKASPWSVWSLIANPNDTSGNGRDLSVNGSISYAAGPFDLPAPPARWFA